MSIFTPEGLAAAKERLAEHRRKFPILPIDGEAVEAALSYDGDANPYFITTHLYWDCECEDDYIRASGSGPCPRCGCEQDEMPDSRINEMLAVGIVLDWLHPDVIATYSEHSLEGRPGYPKA